MRPALLAASLALLACSPARPAGWLEEPPLPPTLEEIEPDVAERIRDAAELVREDPESAENWGELGKVLEVLSLRSQAIVCYGQAQLREQGDPQWWYRRGVCRGRMEDMRGAMQDMERVHDLAADYAPAYYRRGTYALEDGDIEHARAAFLEATRVSPEYMGGWVGLARVHLQLDENEAAVAQLEKQIERDPRDATVLRLLASAYRQAGLEREAALPQVGAEDEEDEPGGRFWTDPWQVELRAYRKAPEEHRLARMLERGRVDKVLEALELRRAEEPEETSFLPMLAEAYYRSDRIPEARATYRALIELEPNNIPGRMALVGFHRDAGTPHLALPWLEEANQIDPDFGPAWVVRGAILYDGARWNECIPILERALELDQRNAELWKWLAASQMGTKAWAKAVQAYETYLEEMPRDVSARVSLAKAHAKLNDVEAARAELDQVRKLKHAGMLPRMAEVEQLIERAIRRNEREGKRGDKDS